MTSTAKYGARMPGVVVQYHGPMFTCTANSKDKLDEAHREWVASIPEVSRTMTVFDFREWDKCPCNEGPIYFFPVNSGIASKWYDPQEAFPGFRPHKESYKITAVAWIEENYMAELAALRSFFGINCVRPEWNRIALRCWSHEDTRPVNDATAPNQ